ncbi:MAG: hypothetical protein ACREJ2_05860 [Planctomycetota bacterium]
MKWTFLLSIGCCLIFSTVDFLGAAEDPALTHVVTLATRDLTQFYAVSGTGTLQLVMTTVAGPGVQLVPKTSKVLQRDSRIMWSPPYLDSAEYNVYTAIAEPGTRVCVAVTGDLTTGGNGSGTLVWNSNAIDIDIDMDTNRDGPENVLTDQDTNPKEAMEDAKEDQFPGVLCVVGQPTVAVIRRLKVDTLQDNTIYLVRVLVNGKPTFDAVATPGGPSLFTGDDLQSRNLYNEVKNAGGDFRFYVVALEGGSPFHVTAKRGGTNETGPIIDAPPDEVAATPVEVKSITVSLQSTQDPANKTRPPADSVTQSDTTIEFKDTVVVMRNAGPVEVTAKGLSPAAAINKVRWHIVQNVNDSVPQVDLPIMQDPNNPLKATVTPNAPGSFCVICYLDDGSGHYSPGDPVLATLPITIVSCKITVSSFVADEAFSDYKANLTGGLKHGTATMEIQSQNHHAMDLTAQLHLDGGGKDRKLVLRHC